MKFYKYCILSAIAFSIFSTQAGTCGGGKIKNIVEGGWNSNDLLIKLDYSKEKDYEHKGTEFNEYIRFKKATVPERIDGIRAIALAAMMADKTVYIQSHNSNCGDSTQISLWKD